MITSLMHTASSQLCGYPTRSDYDAIGHRAVGCSRCATLAFRSTQLLSLLCLVALTGGCNRNSRLDVAQVKGRVTYRGQGVPKATVVFIPSDDAVEKAKKMRPYAYADNDGNFEIGTYKEGDGAPPGKYRVIVLVASAAPATGGKDRPAGESEPTPGKTLSIPPALNQKYSTPETSGLQVTVEKGENTLPPFELK